MSSPPGDLQNATVLVVDDIAANRNVLRRTLEEEGCEVGVRLADYLKIYRPDTSWQVFGHLFECRLSRFVNQGLTEWKSRIS